jgi:hypothetical protein
MEYSREEWKQMFPEEPYPLDMTEEDMYYILSMIQPPQEMEEE